MYINGVGVLGLFGKGKTALAEAINSDIKVTDYESMKIDLKKVKDKSISQKLRRTDRFTKIAVYSVSDAISDMGGKIDYENTGLIVATAFGPHNTTFDFIDEIITFGEDNVSPIKFSHSVHNAAAAYISQVFGIRGSVTTVAQFKFPVQQALELASCWLESKLCNSVIVCCVDENGEVMNAAAYKKYRKRDSLLSEGAAAFILSKHKNKDNPLILNNIKAHKIYPEVSGDYLVCESNDLVNNATFKNKKGMHECKDFSHIYGNLSIGSAFALAASTLLLEGKLDSNRSSQNCTPVKVTCLEKSCDNNFYTIDIMH